MVQGAPRCSTIGCPLWPCLMCRAFGIVNGQQAAKDIRFTSFAFLHYLVHKIYMQARKNTSSRRFILSKDNYRTAVAEGGSSV